MAFEIKPNMNNTTHIHNNTVTSQPILRIAQLNLNRSKAASLQLQQIARQDKYDILLIQEPHLVKNKISGFAEFQTFCTIDPTDSTKTRAGIVICNPNLAVFHQQQLSNPNLTVIRITQANGDIGMISAYVPGSIKHPTCNQLTLDTIQQAIRGLNLGKVCLGMDANAYAVEWGAPAQCPRGRNTLDLIAAEDLFLLNDGITPTYHHISLDTSSFIDITLVSRALSPITANWFVHETDQLSDHRTITFEIGITEQPLDVRTIARRFNTKKANWDSFDNLLRMFKPVLAHMIQSSNTRAELLTTTQRFESEIRRTTRATIPFAKPFAGAKRWWTPELTAQKRLVRRLQNRLGYRRDEYEHRKRLFTDALRKYKNMIVHAKEEDFRLFCTIDPEADPWGQVFNIFKKKHINAPLKQLRTDSGTFTTSESETIQLLLEKYFPYDDPAMRTSEEQQIIELNQTDPDTPDDPLFTEHEVKYVINNMGNKKCPGPDLISAEILKRIARTLLPELTAFFNKCLELGLFPPSFKTALVKFIPKPNYDTTDTHKAYRPICLLNTMGKTLDSLMIRRIQWFLKTNDKLSRYQYGFTPQTSTVDAVLDITRRVQSYRKKHYCVLLISLDIESAFDSAKWHFIIKALKERHCPRNLYRLAKDYFSARKVIAETQSSKCQRYATQGAMQGSPSGPIFWNLVYDDLLRLPFEEHVHCACYADDTILLVGAATEKTAGQRATRALKLITDWADKVKLTFSATKTNILCFGKGADKDNKPLVTMHGQSIAYCTELKYLGVTLDKNLNFYNHVKITCNKAHKAVASFIRVSRNEWGLGVKALKTIWERAIVPAITYASPVWAKAVTYDSQRSKLRTVQRILMLRLARAYRTTSHAALWAITGLPPIDLVCMEMAAIYHTRRATAPDTHDYRPDILDTINFDELIPATNAYTLPHPSARTDLSKPFSPTAKMAKEQLRQRTLDIWQTLWNQSDKGRRTHVFFPSIRDRLDLKHYQPDPKTTQYLTGHGDFLDHLVRFKLRPPDQTLCVHCDSSDNHEHRLYHCPRFLQQRETIRIKWNTDFNNGTSLQTLIRTPESWAELKSYIHDIDSISQDSGATTTRSTNMSMVTTGVDSQLSTAVP